MNQVAYSLSQRVWTTHSLAPKANDEKLQPLTHTAITESEQSVLASCLALSVQDHPDLARLIEAWPSLPDDIKAQITNLISEHGGDHE